MAAPERERVKSPRKGRGDQSRRAVERAVLPGGWRTRELCPGALQTFVWPRIFSLSATMADEEIRSFVVFVSTRFSRTA